MKADKIFLSILGNSFHPRLTAIVFDRTAYSGLIDRPAPGHAQSALLHDAGRPVPDAVAELARILRIDGKLGAVRVEPVVHVAPVVVVESDRRRAGSGRRASGGGQQLNGHLWTGDDGAALVRPFLNRAILADRFRERANPEVAHQHSIVARAV